MNHETLILLLFGDENVEYTGRYHLNKLTILNTMCQKTDEALDKQVKRHEEMLTNSVDAFKCVACLEILWLGSRLS